MTAAARPLPHDLEAEAAVIGAALFDNGEIPAAAAVLPDGRAFYRPDHGFVWDAVLAMSRQGEVVDLVTLAAELSRLGRPDLARNDGPLLDGPLAEVMARGTLSWYAPAYAQRVRSAAVLRGTIETFEAGIREAYAHRDDPAAVLARARDRIAGVADDSLTARSFRAADLLPGTLDRIRQRQGGVSTGVRTGFEEIDGVTDGFQPGELVVIGARPSQGKTAMALNMADHIAVVMGRPALFVSLEMSNPSLAERMVVSRAMVDGHKVRLGDPFTSAEADRIEDAARDIEAAPLFMVRKPGRDAARIANEIRMCHARDGIEVAFVDYLQLMDAGGHRDNENAALTKILSTFKALVTDIEIPVVLLSQFSRASEKREERRPRMADLRGSGSIEQDADIVLLLHRPESFDPADRPGVAEVNIAKNRNGRTGTFEMKFDGRFMRFENWHPDAVPAIYTPDF